MSTPDVRPHVTLIAALKVLYGNKGPIKWREFPHEVLTELGSPDMEILGNRHGWTRRLISKLREQGLLGNRRDEVTGEVIFTLSYKGMQAIGITIQEAKYDG